MLTRRGSLGVYTPPALARKTAEARMWAASRARSARVVASSRRRYLRLAAAPRGCCIATNRVPVYAPDVREPSPRESADGRTKERANVEWYSRNRGRFNSFTTVHCAYVLWFFDRHAYVRNGGDLVSHAQLFTCYTLAVDTLYSSISVGRQTLRGSPGEGARRSWRPRSWVGSESRVPFLSLADLNFRRRFLPASFFQASHNRPVAIIPPGASEGAPMDAATINHNALVLVNRRNNDESRTDRPSPCREEYSLGRRRSAAAP